MCILGITAVVDGQLLICCCIFGMISMLDGGPWLRCSACEATKASSFSQDVLTSVLRSEKQRFLLNGMDSHSSKVEKAREGG